ncbi:hypothetical protein [Bacillus manliponensis]
MKKTYTSPTLVEYGKAVQLTQAKCMGGYPESMEGYDYYKPNKCR